MGNFNTDDLLCFFTA